MEKNIQASETAGGASLAVDLPECSFFIIQVTFTMDETRTSGNAKLLNCPHCSRSVWVEFKGEKYYKENVK